MANTIRVDQLTTQGHWVEKVTTPTHTKLYDRPYRVMKVYHPSLMPGMTVFALANGDEYKLPNHLTVTVLTAVDNVL